MKKILLLLICFITFSACQVKHRNKIKKQKRVDVHVFKSIDAKGTTDAQDDILVWYYILFTQNNRYYYYISPVQLQSFKSISWSYSATSPVANMNNIQEEEKMVENLEDLPNDIQDEISFDEINEIDIDADENDPDGYYDESDVDGDGDAADFDDGGFDSGSDDGGGDSGGGDSGGDGGSDI